MAVRFGARGEAWVVAQALLIAAAIAAPPWEGPWPPALRGAGRLTGLPLALTGAALLAAGSQRLGRTLTPFPRPRDGSVLVEDGAYAIVRHPIYGGILLLLLGGALATGRLARLGVALGAVAFFDAKSRREEVWLAEQFPAYPEYRRRVRKLIPGLY